MFPHLVRMLIEKIKVAPQFSSEFPKKLKCTLNTEYMHVIPSRFNLYRQHKNNDKNHIKRS